ncbi:MAG: acyltransferase family protein [Prevotella sp.]|nr:acyltransferase family protein [Prevotella sp.]
MADNKEYIISFDKYKYDPFLDFVKGICIVLVILTHCINYKLDYYSGFSIWGRPAVPVFLVIQVFHCYKRGINNASFNLSKIWNRIFKPFIYCQLFILCFIAIAYLFGDYYGLCNMLIRFLKSGGLGPGAYYPWIYIQFAILLPLFKYIYKINNLLHLLFLFVILSHLSELFFIYFDMPEEIYSIIFIRYVFLIYIGYICVYKGLVVNKFTIPVIIISLIFTLLFVYSDINFSPFFYTETRGWKTCHWVCYIYMTYLFLLIIKLVYDKINKNGIIVNFCIQLGKKSYEIFLFQIAYFFLLYNFLLDHALLLLPNYLAHIVLIILSLIICILPIYYLLIMKPKNY